MWSMGAGSAFVLAAAPGVMGGVFKSAKAPVSTTTTTTKQRSQPTSNHCHRHHCHCRDDYGGEDTTFVDGQGNLWFQDDAGQWLAASVSAGCEGGGGIARG